MNSEKRITLRNLYRMLTQVDYPLPSVAVLSKKNHLGLTQTNFLRSVCLPVFQSGNTGSMLWRTGENRSRYYSNLCNRSLTASLHSQYALELAGLLTPSVLQQQVQLFSNFLTNRDYRHRELALRIEHLINAACEEAAFTPRISAFFDRVRSAADTAVTSSARSTAADAWILSWMFLFSMTDVSFELLLDVVAQDLDAYSVTASRDMKSHADTSTAREGKQSGSASAMLGAALAPGHYFGHENEKFDLVESVRLGEKILISGMGGMGKTEMVRQILHQCERDSLIGASCLVPYSGSLFFSFSRLFPEILHLGSEEAMNDMVACLSELLSDRGLLIIDNMDQDLPDDRQWLARLSGLKCAVLITSRRGSLEGFRTHFLKEPTAEDCLLIYRDHLGSVMPREDQELFSELMRNSLLRHPQTIRLLSLTARRRSFTLGQIISELRDQNSLPDMLNDRGGESLQVMYRHLYTLHKLSPNEKLLAEFFAVLPAGAYEKSWLNKVVSLDGDSVGGMLTSLVEAGFLQDLGSCCAMHPLVAQCLRKKTYTPAKLNRMLDRLADACMTYWGDCFSSDMPDRECLYASSILCSLTGLILSTVTEGKLLTALIQSIHRVSWVDELPEKRTGLLLKAIRSEIPDPVSAEEIFHALLSQLSQGHPDEIADLYARIQNERQPRKGPIHLNFLITCGFNMTGPAYVKTGIGMIRQAISLGCDTDTLHLAAASLIELLIASGNLEGALQAAGDYLRKITDKPTGTPTRCLFQCLYSMTHIFLLARRDEEIDRCIERMKKVLAESGHLPVWVSRMKAELAGIEGMRCLQQDRPAEAISSLQTHLDMIRKANGSKSVIVTDLGSIALTYMKMGEPEKSAIAYEEALAAMPADMPAGSVSVLLNNYAVLCIEQNKPGKALHLLQQAIAKVPGQPSAYAEPYRNMARAYELTGEKSSALLYWKKALPLLTANYGPDHPRVKEAEEHIKAL